MAYRESLNPVEQFEKTKTYVNGLADANQGFTVNGKDFNIQRKALVGDYTTTVAEKATKRSSRLSKAIPFVGSIFALTTFVSDASAAETDLQRADAVASNLPGHIPVVGYAFEFGYEIGTIIRDVEIEIGNGNSITIEKLSEGTGEAFVDIANENGGGVTGYLKGVVNWWGQTLGISK